MIFREMRRKKQQLTEEECIEIMARNTSGVLAVSGDNDYPYAVPLSYVFEGNKIYFHCAKSGHKLGAIQRNCKASFCVIDQDLIVPEKYTTYFRSVIAFGKMRIVQDEQEKRTAIERLAIKYAPDDSAESRHQAINREWAPLCILEMSIEYITGKAAIELVNDRP